MQFLSESREVARACGQALRQPKRRTHQQDPSCRNAEQFRLHLQGGQKRFPASACEDYLEMLQGCYRSVHEREARISSETGGQSVVGRAFP